ncbi:MAG: DUF1697 domain-containing protein [Clostridia bacterium]|nr:DUF1697 domain-containing protein [Clostridia bacterium]
MITYISILRGINVSGKNSIKMAALKKMYENLNFGNITTYVQSGNVIFQSKITDTEKLHRTIAHEIEKEFGFRVPVIVLTVESLKTIINQNPFVDDNKKEPSFMHVTFLAAPPQPFDPEHVVSKKNAEEEIFFTHNAVYLYCPNGYGRTKLNNTFLENQLKVVATTRNWKTTTKLLEIALGAT